MWYSTQNKNLRWRESEYGGFEYSEDGITWYFTMRTPSEIAESCGLPNLNPPEQFDPEVFGDTLDEPIPEEYYNYLNYDCTQ